MYMCMDLEALLKRRTEPTGPSLLEPIFNSNTTQKTMGRTENTIDFALLGATFVVMKMPKKILNKLKISCTF